MADPLSRNPLDQRQVRLTLLTRSASSRIKQLVEAHTKLGDPIEMTNIRESPPGFDNDFLNKIIARYALNPLFKNPVNLENLVFKDALWWHHNAIVVPKVDSLCEDILMECHDAFYNGYMDITKSLETSKNQILVAKLEG